MPFIIRSQGFMYNDEYNAPDGPLRTLVRRVYAQREQAEEVLERLHRSWLRNVWRLDDWLWNRPEAARQDVIDLILQLRPEAYNEATFDDYGVLEVPEGLTDDELDELVEAGQFEIAVIHEIEDRTIPDDGPDPVWIDEIDYGSPQLYEALTRFDPTPWPPAPPTPRELVDVPAAVQVAWDWVAANPLPEPVPRTEARRRARELQLTWYDPVHRAMLTFAPDVPRLQELLAGG